MASNQAFLVNDVSPDLDENEYRAALVVALKPASEGTEIYLRVAPGLTNRDVVGFLEDLLQAVRRNSGITGVFSPEHHE
jgi:hypothetical protein